MKIRILDSALEDLQTGRQFYENQVEGVGEYFFDALFADIDFWLCMPEFTGRFLDITACWPKDFHTPFMTKWKIRTP
jgi:hypothetical protein